ncbi:hypothetical protein BV20DRAFT_933053 [Pilatotrama ljubarskyi]|nr:hypothetical protein BV20DRAFT_933053 [Pilatotrama ljubarskyi]
MASSTRFTTPPASSPPREPVTPDTGLRNRGTPRNGSEHGQGGDASPTSSTISNLSRILEPSRSLYRPIPSAPPSAFGTPSRKVIIRADPALVTCFDPADKELYDLWAPRQ